MYLDPGFAMVIQVLIGFVVSLPLLLGIYWKKVKAWFKGRKDAKGR